MNNTDTFDSTSNTTTDLDTELVSTNTDESEEDALWRRNLSFRDFYKDYCNHNTKRNIKHFCIALYVFIGITLALYLLVFTSLATGTIGPETASFSTVIINLVSVLAILILTIFVHARQSRVCATLVALYSIVTSGISVATTGKPGGLAVLLCSVVLCLHVYSAHREYKHFKE